MPLHDDEMNMRREKREAQRRKQQAEAKRLRITLILAAVVLVLCTAGIVFLTSRSDSSQTTVAAETRPPQKPHPGDRTGHPRSEKHQNHHPHQGGG